MKIFPALDLLDNNAVRLYKGNRSDKKIYGKAKDFIDYYNKCGAKYVHLVDLNGAFDDSLVNASTIREIVNLTPLEVQIGGGIKTRERIKFYLDELNVSRVILGTICVKDPSIVNWAYEEYGPDRIIAGIDAIDNNVMIHGWTKDSQIDLFDLVSNLKNIGIKRYIYTDISRDGTLLGLNLDKVKTLQDNFDIEVIASGGLRSIEDIVQAKKLDVFGCIIGKAFYEGKLDMSAAIHEEEKW